MAHDTHNTHSTHAETPISTRRGKARQIILEDIERKVTMKGEGGKRVRRPDYTRRSMLRSAR